MQTVEKLYSLYFYRKNGISILTEQHPTEAGVTVQQYQAKCIDDEEFKFLQCRARQVLAFEAEEPQFPLEMELVETFCT